VRNIIRTTDTTNLQYKLPV